MAYAFNASVNVTHSDGIQASSQPGGILNIAVLIALKGLMSATWNKNIYDKCLEQCLAQKLKLKVSKVIKGRNIID